MSESPAESNPDHLSRPITGHESNPAPNSASSEESGNVRKLILREPEPVDPWSRSWALLGARVVDPSQNMDCVADVLVHEGKIVTLGGAVQEIAKSSGMPQTHFVDLSGRVICPGLIDIHVHFRDPGQTGKESIATGSASAAAGGFTTVICMPNTSPAIDNPSIVALIQDKIEKDAKVNVHLTGAITKGIAGEELAPIGSLAKAGVLAITDDGRCVQNNDLMRRAVEYASMFHLPVMDHCQDANMTVDAVMNEGYWSAVLGLQGWPATGEDMIVARNIILAELTGNKIHCQHVSSKNSVRLIREARSRGVPISGEACPHHFILTDACVSGSRDFWDSDGAALERWFEETQCAKPEWPKYDTGFKMNPPLRSAEDRAAVLEGVADGTLSILASDHAPHRDFEKEVEFAYAPFGILGLETEFSLSLTRLHHFGPMTLSQVIERFTVGPTQLVQFPDPIGSLRPGFQADITVMDPDRIWRYDVSASPSKSRNNPFHGWPMKGKVIGTMVKGNWAYGNQQGT